MITSYRSFNLGNDCRTLNLLRNFDAFCVDWFFIFQELGHRKTNYDEIFVWTIESFNTRRLLRTPHFVLILIIVLSEVRSGPHPINFSNVFLLFFLGSQRSQIYRHLFANHNSHLSLSLA